MKSFTAVLHCKVRDTEKLYHLGQRIHIGLSSNPDLFVNPNPDLDKLQAELSKMKDCLNAKDGSKQKYQAITDQTVVLCALLKDYIVYVNKIARGDRTIILLSGFDYNDEPTIREIPARALIRRIEDGSTPCSFKVYADRVNGANRYKVETATNIDGPWTSVLDYASLRKLEVRDQTRGLLIYIRIRGGNSLGWGPPSEPASFMPR